MRRERGGGSEGIEKEKEKKKNTNQRADKLLVSKRSSLVEQSVLESLLWFAVENRNTQTWSLRDLKKGSRGDWI